MARDFMPLPPIWTLKSLFELSNKYPSGLEWKVQKARYRPGDQAGRLNKRTGFYVVSVENTSYLAHRIVEYLRSEEDLSWSIVLHGKDNKEKDNRKQLIVRRISKPISQQDSID